MEKKVSFFVDRKKELAALEENGRHAIVVGYRRMGKTHLIIKYLVRAKSKRTVPVYIDMLYFASWADFADALVNEFLAAYDEVSGNNLSSLFRRFSSSISSSFSSLKEIEGTFGIGGVNFLSLKIAFAEKKKEEIELLRGALDFISNFAEKNGISVVIALDEIQSIANFKEMERGLSIIRGELQFTKNIRLIMSGSLPSFIRSQILEKSKPFWKQLKVIEIGPFELYAVQEAAHKIGVPEKHCKNIFDLTKGVPDYVIKVLEKMKEKRVSPLAAFDHIVRDEGPFFSSLISSLSRAEHIVMLRIAKGENYKGLESALGYPPTAVLNGLIKKGLITRNTKGIYHIVDPGLLWYLSIKKLMD